MKNLVDVQIFLDLLLVNDQKITKLEQIEKTPNETRLSLKYWLDNKQLSFSDISDIYRISYFDDAVELYSFNFDGYNKGGIVGSVFIKGDEVVGESSTPMAVFP